MTMLWCPAGQELDALLLQLLGSGVAEVQDPAHVASRGGRQRDRSQRQRHQVQQRRLTEARDGIRLPTSREGITSETADG